MTKQEEFVYNQVLNGCLKEFIGTKAAQDAASNAVDDYKKHKLANKKPLDLILSAIKKAKSVNKQEIKDNKRQEKYGSIQKN